MARSIDSVTDLTGLLELKTRVRDALKNVGYAVDAAEAAAIRKNK